MTTLGSTALGPKEGFFDEIPSNRSICSNSDSSSIQERANLTTSKGPLAEINTTAAEKPRLRDSDAQSVGAMRSLLNMTRRTWYRATPRISKAWVTFRTKIDHGIDWSLTKIEKGLKLKPATIVRNRRRAAQTLHLTSKVASLGTAIAWCTGLAVPPAKLAVLPLGLVALTTAITGKSIARSLAHQMLQKINKSSPDKRDTVTEAAILLKIAEFMNITKQPLVKIHNKPMTRSQILIAAYKIAKREVTACADNINNEKKNQIIDQEKMGAWQSKGEKAKSLELALESALKSTLHGRAFRYSLLNRLKSRHMEEGEVDSARLKQKFLIYGTDNQMGIEEVIEHLEKNPRYSDKRTNKSVANIIEKIVIRPNYNAKDLADLLRLKNQTQIENKDNPSTSKVTLTDEDIALLQKRGIELESVEPYINQPTGRLALDAFNALSDSQKNEILNSKNPSDGTALKVEAAIRDHLFLHAKQYGFSETGEALVKSIQQCELSELIGKIEAVYTPRTLPNA